MRKAIAGLATAVLLLVGTLVVAVRAGDDDPVADPGSSIGPPGVETSAVTPTAAPDAGEGPSSSPTTAHGHDESSETETSEPGATTDGHGHDNGGTDTTSGSGGSTGTTHAHTTDGTAGAGDTTTTHDHTTTGTQVTGTTRPGSTTTTHDHGPPTTGPTSTTEPHHHGPGEDDWEDLPLTRDERILLGDQVRFVTIFFGTRFPTVADAEAGGWVRAGRFSPGAGAHYVNVGFMHYGGPLDPGAAFGLIYDGIADDSELVGVMYYSWAADPPDYFAGPNDRWHKHVGVCFTYNPDGSIDIPFPVDTDDITRDMCNARGGTFLEQTAWMLHVWAFEGWESRYGVFSHINPDLACADGTWDVDHLGFCDGSEVRR